MFVINAGIEPAFSVKFGNRTRIYIVLRESNPDCKTLYVGDGRRYGNMKKNFMETLYLVHEKFFYLGNRTLGTYLTLVQSFLGRQ